MRVRPIAICALAALTVLVLAQPVRAQEALAIGSNLPLGERVMESATGASTSLRQQMGARGLAVIFWCNTCPWVKKYEDRVVALAREYTAAGIGFVAINANDPVAFPDDNLEAMRGQGANYPFPYVVDGGSEAARAFGASRTPQVFLFDASGKLVYEGTVDDSPADPTQVSEEYFRNAMDQVIAGAPVAVQKTKAFGCTIKFP